MTSPIENKGAAVRLGGVELTSGIDYRAPRDGRESELVEIWQAVLRRDRVGIRDNFFDLGGHSLLAVAICSQITRRLNVNVSLRWMFDHPTIEGLAQQMASLGEQSQHPRPIEKADRRQPLPMSFCQQGMWLLQQTLPDPATYNEPVAFRLSGRVDRERVRRALQVIVERHEVLRTALVLQGESLVQHVAAAKDVPLPWLEVDLQAAAPSQKQSALEERLLAEARRPFDLAQAPLWRVVWIELAEDERVLGITFHHSIQDEWTQRLFIQEWERLYAADGQAECAGLPELPVQYADYAVWQRQRLTGELLESQRRYWMDQLRDLPPVLELPTDQARPIRLSGRGAIHEFRLTGPVVTRLRELAREEETSLFTVLLAAFQVWMHRYTGQMDVVVGTPVANRERPEIQSLLGLFLNTLPIRVRSDGRPTFRQVLRQVRECLIGAFSHADLPFEQMVEITAKERGRGHQPLYQVMFVLLEEGLPAFRLDQAEARPLPMETRTSKNDLTLFIHAVDEAWVCRLEYASDLFTAESAARMGRHLTALIQSITDDPEESIHLLKLMPETERHQVMVEWNRTERDYPQDKCVHQLFEEQVERTPDAVAVVFEDQRLTYRELNARANQLGHYLCSIGVGPEVLVGLCVERSLEMVVAVLGILKAGGAYVPLDAGYPHDRLAFMLQDSQARLLLTLQRLRADLALEISDCKVLCLDTDSNSISRAPTDNVKSGASPENLAYVIYTSGSTGQPKGVAIEHHSPVTLIHWAQDVFSQSECAGVLFATSICFDLSVFEMFVPLTRGGKVILAENALQLPALPAAGEVTLVNTVPSAMNTLLELEGLPASVSTVNLAGEPLALELVQRIYQLPQVRKVYDLYGPSETTTYSTWALRRPDGPYTVGRPIANTQIYLLDRYEQPVPIGVPGQVYIGGDGLARGYLNAPELTAKKFMADPFSTAPGARIYKTGDLARYLPDGNIEFIGRLDHQVKIRGFRIELGEIEAVLGGHPDLSACAVVTQKEGGGDKTLAAFVVGRESAELSVGTLRQWLGENLPDYMIPSRFSVLPVLPLTPNGKIDRKALQKMDGMELAAGANYVAPRNERECKLVEIWQTVLRRERVGVHDNFFHLGGHSLLAVAICSQLTRRLDVNVPLRWMFDHPTIEELARQLDTLAGAREEAGPIPRADRQAPIPISFAQQPLWLLAEMYPGQTAYNLPHVLRLNGSLDVPALQRGLSEIVRRHEVLRTTFAPSDALPEQRIGPADGVALPVVDLQSLPETIRDAEALRLAGEEAGRPFDLAQGPLLRARLWRSGPETHWLALTLHHSVMDGWSFRIFFHELAIGYSAFVEGSPPALPKLPVQYADFAVWQRERFRGEKMQASLAYWQRQLAGAPPQLDLATDFPHPSVQTFCGRRRSVVMVPPAAAQLLAFNRKEGSTLFMTLLAAFQTVLHRHTGQADLVVGAPVANRDRTELEGLIGNFLNTLPLRADLSGDPSFRDFLRRTREATLEAFAHGDMPWPVLLESVPIPRTPGRTPLFQVVFNLHSYETAVPELRGVEVAEFFPQETAALFDLELYARESASGLKFSLVGNAALFTEATLDEILGHLLTLLAEIVANPDRRLSQLPLLTAEQRERAAAQVRESRSAKPFPHFEAADIEQSIPSRFEQQAARHGERLAIATPRHRWTYREINTSANHVAHTLLTRLGAGPHRIALLYEHDAPMVAAILGVLKAGMTYVPLDPLNPEARLRRIMEDAQAAALLSSHGLCSLAESAAPAGVLHLESDATDDPATPATNPSLTSAPDAVAYLLYTSGSTGQPKAVTQNHRNVLHFIRIYARALHLTPEDRLSLFPTYGFDAAVMDIFGALLNGASLHLRQVRETTAPEILEFLRAEGVTVYHSTPTLYRHLIGSLAPGEVLPSVRLVVLGGEAVVRSDVELHRRHFTPGCLLVNGFGPTECTVAAQHFIPHRTALRGGRVPVGHPVDGMEILILDEAGAERGVAGEIALRSPHVALGYWRQPELTRERFFADPAGGPGGIFRTGDLGWRRPDGTLEFLGRKDFQVKVRGYRIELGEIEAALRSLPDVEEAVVIQRDDLPDEQPLAAYVRLTGSASSTTESLRNELRRSLPDYMVPAAIVVLDELPLLSNGKLNRRALPKPDLTRAPAGVAYAAPRTPAEEVLARIWAEVLKVKAVGIHDSFFELGGHSLLAAQVVSRIRREFDLDVALRAIFESPTIETLAIMLLEKQAQADGAGEMERLLAELEALPEAAAEDQLLNE